jgi:hypothetical protein
MQPRQGHRHGAVGTAYHRHGDPVPAKDKLPQVTAAAILATRRHGRQLSIIIK